MAGDGEAGANRGGQPANSGDSRRPQRRLHVRHPVDCEVNLVALTGAAQIRGTIRELSLTGCLVATESSLDLGYQVRVEIEFRLHGNVFRINGITAGTRSNRSFGVRFLDLSDRRRQQLAGVVAEVEAGNLARAASVDS